MIRKGAWIAFAADSASIVKRTCAIGVPGPASEGRAVHGQIGAWASARTVVGPDAAFGTHFAPVLHVLDDRDGDGQAEFLATDPGLHVGDDDSRLFAGGLYLVCSSNGTTRLLGNGGSAMTFLGIAMLPVDDVDGGGLQDVVLLAMPHGERGPFFEVWSVESLSRLRRIDCWNA